MRWTNQMDFHRTMQPLEQQSSTTLDMVIMTCRILFLLEFCLRFQNQETHTNI